MASREQNVLHGFWVTFDSPSEHRDNLLRSIKLIPGDAIEAAILNSFYVWVVSGEILGPGLGHYAIEQVQAYFYVSPRMKNDNQVVSMLRQRMFRYEVPVTKEMVPELSEVTPRQPYVEWNFNLYQLAEKNEIELSHKRLTFKQKDENSISFLWASRY